MLRKYLSILTILILGSMLTVSVFSIMRNDETRRIKENLTDIADNYTNAIQNKLFEHINVLEALVSFYATNKIVNRQQFQIFSSSLLRSHPNIQALYWMPRVTHQQRHAWEVQLDKHYAFKFLTEYNDDNKLTVATERKEYFPIYYTIPHDEKKIGIDISTHSTFQPFLEQARTKQKYVVTGHIDLPCVDKTGFKVIYPVHTISEASQPPILLGFLIGVFTLDMMIENQALYKLPQNMHVRIYDNYDQRLLYSSHDDEKYLANEQIGYKNKKVLHLAEREWTIEFHVDANYVNLARGWQPFTTAIGGFFFMVLLLIFFFYKMLNMLNRFSIIFNRNFHMCFYEVPCFFKITIP